MKKCIALIGAGTEHGIALAKNLATGRNRLLLMAEDCGKSNSLASYIVEHEPTSDIQVANCPIESCWEADVILLALPSVEEQEIARSIRHVATQKIVVSVSGRNQPGDSDSLQTLQALFPYSRIIKALMPEPGSDCNIALRGVDQNTVDDVRALLNCEVAYSNNGIWD